MMPGKQARAKLTPSYASSRTASQGAFCAANGVLRCVPQYVRTIPNGHGIRECVVQSSMQGPQFQYAFGNNSYAVNGDGFAQRNGDHAPHRPRTSGTTGVEPSAQLVFPDNLRVETSEKCCDFVAKLLGLNPPHYEFEKDTDGAISGLPKDSVRQAQFSSNFYNNAVAENTQFSRSAASNLGLNCTAPHTRRVLQATPLNNSTCRGRPAVALEQDAVVKSELKYTLTPANFSSINAECSSKTLVNNTEVCNQLGGLIYTGKAQCPEGSFQPSTGFRIAGQGYTTMSQSNATTPAPMRKVGIGNTVSEYQNWVSTAGGTHTVVYRPFNPPLQKLSPKFYARRPPAVAKQEFSQVSDNSTKVCGRTNGLSSLPLISPQRSPEGSCDEDSMPKIIACYSLSSKANEEPSKSNSISNTFEGNAVGLPKTRQYFPSNSEERRNTAFMNLVSQSRKVAETIKPSMKFDDSVHCDESASNAIRQTEHTVVLTPRVVDCEKRSQSDFCLPEKSTEINKFLRDKLSCPIGSKIGRKDTKMETYGSLGVRPTLRKQDDSYSTEGWRGGTETMRVVGNYPSTIIISRNSVPKTSCQDSHYYASVVSSNATGSNVDVQVVCSPRMNAARNSLTRSQHSSSFVREEQTRIFSNAECQVTKIPLLTNNCISTINTATAYSAGSKSALRTESVSQQKQSNGGGCRNAIGLKKSNAKLSEAKSSQWRDVPLDYSIGTLRLLEKESSEQTQNMAIDLSMPKSKLYDSLQNRAKPSYVESEFNTSSRAIAGQEDKSLGKMSPSDTASFETLCTVELSREGILQNHCNLESPKSSHFLTSPEDNSAHKSGSVLSLKRDTKVRKSKRHPGERNNKRVKDRTKVENSTSADILTVPRKEIVVQPAKTKFSNSGIKGIRKKKKSRKTKQTRCSVIVTKNFANRSHSECGGRQRVANSKLSEPCLNAKLDAGDLGTEEQASGSPTKGEDSNGVISNEFSELGLNTILNTGDVTTEEQADPYSNELPGEQISNVFIAANRPHLFQDAVSKRASFGRRSKRSSKLSSKAKKMRKKHVTKGQSKNKAHQNENKGAENSPNSHASTTGKNERFKNNLSRKKSHSEHKEKSLIAKDVNRFPQHQELQGEIEKKSGCFRKADAILNGKMTIMHQKTAPQEETLQSQNFLKELLKRLNSAEMKDDLSDILENEMANAIPESLHALFNADETMCAVEKTCNESLDASLKENILTQLGFFNKEASDEISKHELDGATNGEASDFLCGVPSSSHKGKTLNGGAFHKSSVCSDKGDSVPLSRSVEYSAEKRCYHEEIKKNTTIPWIKEQIDELHNEDIITSGCSVPGEKFNKENSQNLVSLPLTADDASPRESFVPGHKKSGSINSDCSSAANRKTPLKLGYNVSASWSRNALKIKRRKLIKKVDNCANSAPKTTQKKSSSTYMLLSDLSDSADEGADASSNAGKAGDKVRRRKRRASDFLSGSATQHGAFPIGDKKIVKGIADPDPEASVKMNSVALSPKNLKRRKRQLSFSEGAAQLPQSPSGSSHLEKRFAYNSDDALAKSLRHFAAHTKIFARPSFNKDSSSEKAARPSQLCDSDLLQGEVSLLQSGFSSVSASVDATKHNQSRKRPRSARITGNWKMHEWPKLTKLIHQPLPCPRPDIRTKSRQNENMFMALHKLFSLGIITERIPSVLRTTARKSSTIKRTRKTTLGQAVTSVLPTLPRYANDYTSLQNLESRCFSTGANHTNFPCSAVTKNTSE